MIQRANTPLHPTRERRLYGAAARGYVAAMRDLFLFPMVARRELRLIVGLDEDAISRMTVLPDIYGPLKSEHADGAVAADAALLYWTMYERRPRALLWTIATTLRTEWEWREAEARRTEADSFASIAANDYEWLRQPRHEARQQVAAMVNRAAYVYAVPGPACRNIWRSVRRRGAEATRRVLEEKPQTFGRLYSVRLTRFGVFPYNDTTMAREIGLPSLLRCFDAVIEARVKRKVAKAGPTFRARARMVKMRAAAEAVARPQRYGKPVDEAGRLIAVLMRRRDVDEPRDERNPLPKVRDQLAAMLPAEAAGLIEEAFRASRKHSGEDPVWIRGQGVEVELELDRSRRPAVSRERRGLDI
ncbi:MAG TPA: hypothetical protein VGC13_24410 [Longimicrobium sp.]|jgi:hypothetical protein|uniref:hypothetical protein n=1 Tax=Longimicrobium sp. TaxID=2029185 RepID=UPI002EDAE54B